MKRQRLAVLGTAAALAGGLTVWMMSKASAPTAPRRPARAVANSDAATTPAPAAPRAAVRHGRVDSGGRDHLWADTYAFPVDFSHDSGRMNVAIVTEDLPHQVWSSPAFRALLRVDASGHFPVRVWRLRTGNRHPLNNSELPDAMLIQVLRVPAEPTRYVQFSVGQKFERGDVLAVEYVPGLLARDRLWPIASRIDNRSGDPITVPAARMRIPLTGNCYEISTSCGG